MKLKYEQLLIYEVNGEYINYLAQFDKNVRLKSERRYTDSLL